MWLKINPNKLHKTILSLLMLLTTIVTEAQPPSKFYCRYGGNGYDVGYDVKQTLDNGYIITGSTSSFGQGNTDMYLLKLDSMGQVKFQTSFGGYSNEVGKSIVQLSDSSFVMVGYTSSTGVGGYDIFLVKADKSGNLVWQKTIGGADWDFAYSLQATTDGGFIIAGTTYSFGHGNADGYIIKTNSTGDTTWTKTYGGLKEDEFKSVIQTTDGNYALTGYTKSYNDSLEGDTWTFKVDQSGDSLWSKFYGGNKKDYANDITQLQNLNIVVAGGTKSIPATTIEETLLVAYDLVTGNQIYSYVDPGSNNEYYNSIIEGINGSFTGCGKTKNPIFGFQALIDVYGIGFSYINFYAFATGNIDELFSVCKTKDKGFVCVGVTQGTSFPTLQDILLVKIDSIGNYGSSIIGIKENEQANVSLNIYPNPINDYVNININDYQKYKNINYQIVDINGRILLSNSITQTKTTIEMSELSNGLYFIQIYNSNTLLNSSKISVIK